ncbi:hypothetical protein JTE90_018594 [Oedothorax gibbosus]|uniref:Gustatory receptor n=2 Tax=Oedothorax gibbosus TaxID=931172 RepID=A0AAV6TSU6_9ARAC|nr:hypothetical protein JTE90_018594 [Oedothorax gibbosus]
MSAVVPTAGKTKNILLKYSAILLNTAILVFHAYDCAYLLYGLKRKTVGIAFMVAYAIAFMHRYFLGRRFYSLKRIANIMSNFEIQENNWSKLVILIWIVLSTLHQVLTLGSNMYYGRNNPHVRSLFGLKPEDSLLNDSIVFFYYFHHAILMTLPISVFAIFYTVVCHHLRSVLKQFPSRNLTGGFIDYKKVLQSFNELHMTVESLDDELSIFVLFLTMQASYIVMYVVYFVLNNKDYFTSCWSCIDRLFRFLHIADSSVLFAAMVVAASLIAEAYRELRATVRRSIASLDMEFSLKQQKFLMCTEKEANFTMYKVIEIKRGFLLGVLGGVVTYMILFDNILNIK